MAAKFGTQEHRLDAALSNAGNAVSMLQTQDGTLRSVGNALNRMGELAILAHDITKSDADRALYAEEFTQLKIMVGDSSGMTFNGVEMFGTQSKAVTVSEDGGTTKLRLSIFRLIPTLRRLRTRLLSSRWTVRRQS